jgi:hypothetical protein
MEKRELQPVEIYHEIGHAIIAYIFNEYILSFKRIILNPQDLENIGLNPDDLAYMHTKRIGQLEPIRIEENEHLCTLVVGMTTLGGVGGATYLFPELPIEVAEITPLNFRQKLNLTGASGDFESIDYGANLYSFKLLSNGYTVESMFKIHSKIMNIIQHLFLKPEIKNAADELFQQIQSNPKANVELEKFEEVLGQSLVSSLKEELQELLRLDKFGKLY